ncbi:MAG: imidazole glycerol phosphate synthase subunit HisH [Vicinamibacteria bacterium]|nr:imidazole glycerol phosphate synthase subunit HisH [Vicinamibacteria bacterium]
MALVDYGAGNLTSVRKAFTHLGAEIYTPESPADLSRASAVVVPGVGHFSATRSLTPDWHAAVREGLSAGRPLLGICVGMQWLYEGSTEAPECPGLGVVEGRCTKLTGGADRLKVPHVGWNTLELAKASHLLESLADQSNVYFTHSFAGPVNDATAAATQYGGERFAAAVEDGLIMGVQFHPEKSSETGLAILRNFLRLVARTTQVSR